MGLGGARPLGRAGESSLQGEYLPRQPETTVLHGLVREHLEGFLETSREESGTPLPRFIQRAFRTYLACGIPAAGFTRLLCQRCGHEAILAFSCKQRHLCPSCTARHMDDGAAHLLAHVLPSALPYRQVVISLPFEVRGLLAFRPEVLNAVFRLANDTALRWQQGRGLQHPGGRAAGLAVLQRAGGALNINPHLHLLLADGLFAEGPNGTASFHPLPPPTEAQVAHLACTLHRRLLLLLRRWGLLGGESPRANTTNPLAACIQLALFSPPRQQGPTSIPVAVDEVAPLAPAAPQLCATCHGVNVHAQVTVPANDTEGLAHLVRYLLRPSFSLARLSLREDGAVLYRLRKADKRGRTTLVLSPMEFMARLAALLPSPRFALRRQIGLFAPGARLRIQVPRPLHPRPCHYQKRKPPADEARLSNGPSLPLQPNEGAKPSTRVPWAELLRRTFHIDSLRCPRCDGRISPVAVVKGLAQAEEALRSLGLFTRLAGSLRSWHGGPVWRPGVSTPSLVQRLMRSFGGS